MYQDLITELTAKLKAMPEFKSFETLEILILKDHKKVDYWGTSIKRYYQETKLRGNGYKSVISGSIYVNVRDSRNAEMVIKIVAHEASHLVDGVISEEEMIARLGEKD